MAKATKTESVRAREARLKAEAEEAATAKVAEAAAAQAETAAKEEAARKKAAKSAPRPKRARFVRAETTAPHEVDAAPIPVPSTKPAGRLLSRGVKPVAKLATSEPNRGPAVPRQKRQVRHEGVSRK